MDQNDLKQIKELFLENNKVFIELMDVKLKNIKNEAIGDLEVKMLAWKSEIVNLVDVLAKEIRDEREFRDISSHQTVSNTRRIEKIETKVFGAVQNVV